MHVLVDIKHAFNRVVLIQRTASARMAMEGLLKANGPMGPRVSQSAFSKLHLHVVYNLIIHVHPSFPMFTYLCA